MLFCWRLEQAARVLNLEGFGLAYLLQTILDIHPDKRSVCLYTLVLLSISSCGFIFEGKDIKECITSISMILTAL